MRLTSLVAQTVKRLSTMWETWVRSLGWEVPWRRKWQPTPVLLPGSHGRRSLVSTGLQRVVHDWATSLSLNMRLFVTIPLPLSLSLCVCVCVCVVLSLGVSWYIDAKHILALALKAPVDPILLTSSRNSWTSSSSLPVKSVRRSIPSVLQYRTILLTLVSLNPEQNKFHKAEEI